LYVYSPIKAKEMTMTGTVTDNKIQTEQILSCYLKSFRPE